MSRSIRAGGRAPARADDELFPLPAASNPTPRSASTTGLTGPPGHFYDRERVSRHVPGSTEVSDVDYSGAARSTRQPSAAASTSHRRQPQQQGLGASIGQQSSAHSIRPSPSATRIAELHASSSGLSVRLSFGTPPTKATHTRTRVSKNPPRLVFFAARPAAELELGVLAAAAPDVRCRATAHLRRTESSEPAESRLPNFSDNVLRRVCIWQRGDLHRESTREPQE